MSRDRSGFETDITLRELLASGWFAHNDGVMQRVAAMSLDGVLLADRPWRTRSAGDIRLAPKDAESQIAPRALAGLGVHADLRSHERPDFIAVIDSREIGIEVTEIGNSYAWNALEDLNAAAKRSFTAEGIGGIVHVRLDAFQPPITLAERAAVISQLKELPIAGDTNGAIRFAVGRFVGWASARAIGGSVRVAAPVGETYGVVAALSEALASKGEAAVGYARIPTWLIIGITDIAHAGMCSAPLADFKLAAPEIEPFARLIVSDGSNVEVIGRA
jgi:hypothetical protein